MHQVGELQALHTADHRTVIVIVPVTTTNTVNNPDCLRFGDTIAQGDLTVGGASRIGQAFEFKAGKDVR